MTLRAAGKRRPLITRLCAHSCYVSEIVTDAWQQALPTEPCDAGELKRIHLSPHIPSHNGFVSRHYLLEAKEAQRVGSLPTP